jgi:VanZ family protein
LGKIHHRHIRLEHAARAVFGIRMPRRLLSAVLWLALLGWAGGILCLSSLTPDKLPFAAFLTWDKFNHFVAFAVGGWLAAAALRLSRPGLSPATALVLAIAAVAAFGAFDESLQLLTPGRIGADLYDWIADFLGATTGALFTLVTHARLERLVPRP